MTKREIGKYNSYAQIASTLESHASVYTDHVQFKRGATDFTSALDRLDELSTKQSARPGGFSADKSQALHVLGDLAFRIASAIAACGHDAGNGDLAGRVAYSRSNITRGPEAAVIARCRSIHTTGTEYAEQVAEYGVTTADLTNLKKKIDAFQALQPNPRRARAGVSSATKELKKVIKEADTLLANKLDKLIVQFKDSESDFYNEYVSARKLVITAGRSAKPENIVAVPATTPEAKAA
jgi:hypothetical protein